MEYTNEIKVVVKNVYGTDKVYPFCMKARNFAEIAGTKTLTSDTLRLVRLLGYQVKQQQLWKEIWSMNISDFIDDNPNIIYSPVAESIRESMKLIIKEVSYMEDTGEEFTDDVKYSALVNILNSSSTYFRRNLHI